MTKTRARLDRYFEAFEAGTMKPESYNQKVEELTASLGGLEVERKALEARRQRLDLPAINRRCSPP